MTLDLPDREFAGHIFDCDGTVVDSMPLHYHAWVAALQAHKAPFEFTQDYFYKSAGVAEADVTRRLNAEHGSDLDPEGVVKTKQEWFFEHMHELKSVAAVEEIVRKLAEAGTPISVASGSELCVVEPELEIVGLRDCFEIIVTPEFVEHGKPFPDMFLLAAEKMNVAAADCLVYEDGQSGIDAAAAAGMTSVYVPSKEANMAAGAL